MCLSDKTKDMQSHAFYRTSVLVILTSHFAKCKAQGHFQDFYSLCDVLNVTLLFLAVLIL